MVVDIFLNVHILQNKKKANASVHTLTLHQFEIKAAGYQYKPN